MTQYKYIRQWNSIALEEMDKPDLPGVVALKMKVIGKYSLDHYKGWETNVAVIKPCLFIENTSWTDILNSERIIFIVKLTLA